MDTDNIRGWWHRGLAPQKSFLPKMQSPKKKSARAIPVGRQTRRASSELRKLICQPMTEPLRRRSTAKSEKNQKFKLFVLKFNSFQGCRWMLLMSLSDKPYHLVRRRKICELEKTRGSLDIPLFSGPVEVFYEFRISWPCCVCWFSTPNFFKSIRMMISLGV